ncbi:MAG TPA: TIGR03618 family F420-dependent PPOX class oxidoreductase [Actinomycetales bacterium]|nr:TIGR03618 family F420-dependent PPOX class oxidoreductase [Actinomycetales bacterium]
MTTIDDPQVARLLREPNHAVITTFLPNGSVHGTVVWVDVLDGRIALNTAVGRVWPNNLERDPRITLVVYDQANPYEYVEVRGRATGRTEGADAHIDRLAKKYLGADTYPFRQEGEQRISYLVDAERIRHVKQ